MGIDDLAGFIRSQKRLPDTLRCAVDVYLALRKEAWQAADQEVWTATGVQMLAMRVVIEPLMPSGAWEVSKGGELVASGMVGKPNDETPARRRIEWGRWPERKTKEAR